MLNGIVIDKDGKAVRLSDEQLMTNLKRNIRFQKKHGSIRYLKKERGKLIKQNKSTFYIDIRIGELRNSQFSHWVLKKNVKPINIKKWDRWNDMGLLGPIKNISRIEELVPSLHTIVEDEDGKKTKITIQYLYNNNNIK